MKNSFLIFCFVGILILLSILACTSTTNDPSTVVVQYLNSLVKMEPEKALSFSCQSFQNTIQKEIDSLQNVSATLKNLNCATKTITEGKASVTCSGSIQLSYGAEVQNIELNRRIFILIKEKSDWCIFNYQ